MTQQQTDYMKGGFFSDWKADTSSGLVVFLVALPLCLGIALASGAPLFAGVIAGIIGGIVVALISGSEVSVSGPAAGLAVIVAESISSIGSYEGFLTAVVLAGVFQVVFGALRLGTIGNYIPISVIKGMLAAIGAVIILKQIPHTLGYDKNFEGDMAFQHIIDDDNTFSEIIKALYSFSTGAVIVTAIALVILLLWERPSMKKNPFFALIPGPLVVVFAGIGLNAIFKAFLPEFEIRADQGHLVALPVADSVHDFLGFIRFPNFSVIAEQQIWITAGIIAVVASIETLLSLEAADALDPQKRISSTNRELFAQGIGNTISGLLGGLPVTSVIVRTSANIYAGAKTRFSGIFHGFLLFGSAMFIPSLLNQIPLACLAAILIMVGYKLTSVKVFKSMFSKGIQDFIPFLVTFIAIISTDLLIGVFIGLGVSLIFVIKTNHHASVTIVNEGNNYLLRFNKDMSFVNKSAVKEQLRLLPANSSIIIDGTRAAYIDHDIYQVIEDFVEFASHRNITVELKHISAKTVPFTFKKEKV